MIEYVEHLRRVFRSSRDKHEAHRNSQALLQDMSADRDFIRAVLEKHLRRPGSLAMRNYPVVGMEVELNADFGVVLNGWIPLPDRSRTISSKAIHHHGEMLLTSATVLGPGYEHWLFTRPRLLDAARELFEIQVSSRESHPAQHVAFVDAYVPHMPWYPPDTTLTLCLWSSQKPTTWRDGIKRIPLLKRNEARLRRLAGALRIRWLAARVMDLKVVEYFDFYPVADGFRGMRDRQEYDLGPNEDYLYSLFHVLQRTSNEGLAAVVDERLDAEPVLENHGVVKHLLAELRAGTPIEGRLSGCHLSLQHAMFPQGEVDNAIRALSARP